VSFGVLAPELRVLAPIRDANIPREKAISLAGEWGIPIADVVTTYSVDENLWGRTAECGPLEDPWVAPPEEAFRRTAAPADRPHEPAETVVSFERGVPVALDGASTQLPALIRSLDSLGGSYGFGRIDMVENRRVGIKSRELYEAPGALAIIGAHQALEDLTLERDLSHHKPLMEQRWADLVYDGQWFGPLRRAIDAYFEDTQTHVSGDVRIKFEPGSATVVGRRSEHSLYDLSLATYGGGDAFDQTDAEGFTRLFGLPLKVWSAKQGTGS
jgi:argininosuccinate synthase